MTASQTNGFRWGIERRLEFVEYRLFWEGGVNRSDIVQEFGVSVPQASKDLALYQEQAPDNIVYDRSEKRYFASDKFQPKIIELDASGYLAGEPAKSNQLVADQATSDRAVSTDQISIPQRVVAAGILRSLLAATRAPRSVEILYQSMSGNRPEPIWRRISPHAFANDGLRWHVRAFCHVDRKFKDFILSRCLDVRGYDNAGSFGEADRLWNTHFQVILAPNPGLSVSQRNVIAQDFGMEGGQISVPVRQAMLYYFAKRLRLDTATNDQPHENPVVVFNRDEFDAALSEAMS